MQTPETGLRIAPGLLHGDGTVLLRPMSDLCCLSSIRWKGVKSAPQLAGRFVVNLISTGRKAALTYPSF